MDEEPTSKITFLPVGRWQKYDAEIADQILDLVSQGRSLAAACDEIGFPVSTAYYWNRYDREGFAARLTKARWSGAHVIADDILRLADGQMPVVDLPQIEGQLPEYRRARLDELNSAEWTKMRIQAREWYLKKVAPREYGDKVEVTHQGGDKPVQHVHGLMTDEEAARQYSENARRIGSK